jgi:MFS family permease
VAAPGVTGPGERPGRAVVALLAAMFCNSVAYTGLGTALGLEVYDVTHHEFDLGLLGMAQFAPVLALVLVAGSISDRFDRALVCSLSVAGQAVIAALLAVYAATHPSDVGPIFLLAVTLGAARAFMSAAQGPLPADIVAADRLPWLMARRALVSRFGQVAGPILAGLLYAIDPSLAYLAVAAVFAVSSAALWTIRVRRPRPNTAPDPAASSPVREALEGIRVIRRAPLLLGVISLDLFAVLFGGAIALLPAIAEDRLGVDAVGLGFLRAATGIGSIVVLVVLAWRPVEQRVGRMLLAAVAVFGVGTVVLGITTEFAAAFLALAVLSGADSVSVFIRSNLVPLATPVAVRGRVSAVNNLFVGASNELGAFESGVTGELLGSGPAVVLGGAATLLVVGAYTFRFPELRGLDRYPTVGEPDRGGRAPAST